MAGKQLYITEEIEWFEDRLREIKADIDSTPYAQITERIVSLDDGKGNQREVISETISQQKKTIRDSLKEYQSLLEATNKLREQEEAKVSGRGGQKLNKQMRELGTS